MCVYVWIRVYVVVLLGRSLRFLCCAICRRVGLLGSSFQNVLLFVDWCTPSGMVGGLGFVVGFLWREGGGLVLVEFGVGRFRCGSGLCRSVSVSIGFGVGRFGSCWLRGIWCSRSRISCLQWWRDLIRRWFICNIGGGYFHLVVALF